jgi:hypothetical protein
MTDPKRIKEQQLARYQVLEQKVTDPLAALFMRDIVSQMANDLVSQMVNDLDADPTHATNMNSRRGKRSPT